MKLGWNEAKLSCSTKRTFYTPIKLVSVLLFFVEVPVLFFGKKLNWRLFFFCTIFKGFPGKEFSRALVYPDHLIEIKKHSKLKDATEKLMEKTPITLSPTCSSTPGPQGQ